MPLTLMILYLAIIYSYHASTKNWLAGYDLIDENLEFIQNTTIVFPICQKPEEQDYKSTIFKFLLTGKSPDKINHNRINFVIKENTDFNRNINPSRI